MKAYLLMVFFISPPTAPGKQVWQLQSTTTMEFSSIDTCRAFHKSVKDNFHGVATVEIRAWCMTESPKARVRSGSPEPGPEEFEHHIETLPP